MSVTKSLIIIVQGKSRVASPSYTSHRGHYLLMPRTATLRKSVVHWRGQPQRFPYLLIFPSPFYSTESFHISSPLSTILISNRGELKIFNYEKRRIVNYLFELYIRKKNWIGGGDEEVWFALATRRNMVGLVLRWWLGWIRDASFTHRLSPVHV